MPEVENFIIRPNKFDGFNDLADTIERREARNYQRGQQQQRRKDNLMDDALRYTDPSQFFTGTPLDPVITGNLKSILADAAKMITEDENMDNAMLYTRLAPQIGKLSAASQNLKVIAANNKQRFDALKDHKGIDQDKLRNETIKNAYANPDGTLKDLSQVDPTQDYVDYTLRNSDVYNNAGFDQFAKESKPNTVIGSVKNTDSRGGMKKFKGELTSPNYLISEKDSEGNHIGFVPKYEIATDNGQPLLHEFQNQDGTKTTAPIRLLDKAIMNDLPPDAKAYILQEQRKYAKANNIPINSLEAENFARAIAYDELNTPTKKWGTVKVIEETKQPQIKVYNNSGRGDDASNMNDLYERIKKKGLQRATDYSKGYFPSNALEASDLAGDELEVVIKATQNKDLKPEDLKVIVEDNGRIGIYNKGDGKRLVYLNQTGVNLPKQSGKAGKDVSIKKGNEYYEPQKGNKQNLLQRAANAITGKGKKTYKGLDKDGNPIFE